MSAGIEMEFVRDGPGDEQLVKCLRPRVEAVFVFCPAIEVDLQTSRSGAAAHKRERAIAVPKRRIEGCAKRTAESQRQALPYGAFQLCARQFGNQRGTVRADRAEQLRIAKAEAQGTITAH